MLRGLASPAAQIEALAARISLLETAKNVLDGTFTVDTLPTVDASNVDKYAIVTDLFGEKRDVVRASMTTSGGQPFYYWQPVRPTYAKTMTGTSSMTVYPLKSPSVLLLTGNILIGITQNITLDVTRGFPGDTREISGPASVLGTLKVLGTGLGSGIALLAGGYKKFVCEMVGGTLTWKQLV